MASKHGCLMVEPLQGQEGNHDKNSEADSLQMQIWLLLPIPDREVPISTAKHLHFMSSHIMAKLAKEV